MVPTILLGDQTDTPTHIWATTSTTTGTTKVMVMSATHAEVTDADSAEDTVTNTSVLLSVTTDIPSERDSVLVTITLTSETM